MSIERVVIVPANGAITVGRSLWQDEEGTTKGWNLRTIPLTNRLKEALKALRHARLGKYVLADADGDPFNLEMRWNLPRLCRKAAITVVGWHSRTPAPASASRRA